MDSSPNYWADIIRALHTLVPSDKEATCAIAEMLIRRKVEPDSLQCPSIMRESTRDNKGGITEAQTPTKKIKESTKSTKNPAEISIPSRIEFKGKSPVRVPKWFNGTLAMDIAVSSGSAPSYHLEPLFFPNWTRAILSGILSTYSDIGTINIDEVVNRISRAEPLKEVPRHLLPTMAHGVQVLVDKNDSLEPFYQDQAIIMNSIRKVVGQDLLQTQEFVGCPLRGVRENPIEEWSKYDPPSNGTMVLLLTDLGIVRSPRITERAGISEWLQFAHIARRAGCSLVVLVPYPPHRWPKSLYSKMTIIQWDRTTSAITIQHILQNTLRLIKDERQ